MTQPLIAMTVTDLCGKRVQVTRTRWDKHVSWTTIEHEGIVCAVTYAHHGYCFLIAIEHEIVIAGDTKKVSSIESFWLGDGLGIVLVDPPAASSPRSLDEIAPHLTIEDTSRSCPRCAVSAGFRCVDRSDKPLPAGYMHSERGSAT